MAQKSWNESPPAVLMEENVRFVLQNKTLAARKSVFCTIPRTKQGAGRTEISILYDSSYKTKGWPHGNRYFVRFLVQNKGQAARKSAFCTFPRTK
ncbi:hypothetical protein A7K91_13540 [Paenibacillus oryzae]|uniref:Uncharacterized protein n=1 Tax=Paenibacillus oryzae TaxID=1844972 RepID=A0A1A5YJ31_9BACL|nr:hypothetical protein A7K91_13540 [Paenibacillus oryzae]